MSTSVTLVNDTTSVSLTCEADGATSYYWERQSGSIPNSAIGVNTNTLTIINIQPEDAGNYRCLATNASGSTESNYATLTVNGKKYCLVSYCYIITKTLQPRWDPSYNYFLIYGQDILLESS